MSVVRTQKARKNYCCCKCGASISKGEVYHRVTYKYAMPRILCTACRGG